MSHGNCYGCSKELTSNYWSCERRECFKRFCSDECIKWEDVDPVNGSGVYQCCFCQKQNEETWKLAEALHTRYVSSHGLSYEYAQEHWSAIGEWEQGYWHGVAEFVLEHFERKQ